MDSFQFNKEKDCFDSLLMTDTYFFVISSRLRRGSC